MKRPKIVCLCDSTRFMDIWREAGFLEEMKGNIVLTINISLKDADKMLAGLPDKEKLHIKARADELHLRKIELADEILVLNVGGYVGNSTQQEIDYARMLGKKIRWWEHDIPTWKKILSKGG